MSSLSIENQLVMLTALVQSQQAQMEELLKGKSITPVKSIVRKSAYNIGVKDNQLALTVDLRGNTGVRTQSDKQEVLVHVGNGLRQIPFCLETNGSLKLLDGSPSSWSDAFGGILVFVTRRGR